MLLKKFAYRAYASRCPSSTNSKVPFCIIVSTLDRLQLWRPADVFDPFAQNDCHVNQRVSVLCKTNVQKVFCKSDLNREKNSFWIKIATVFIRKSNRFTSNAVISKQRFTRWEEICKRWFARWCTICTDYQTTDLHRFAKEKNEIYKSHYCGPIIDFFDSNSSTYKIYTFVKLPKWYLLVRFLDL